jgi:hypothetical protein
MMALASSSSLLQNFPTFEGYVCSSLPCPQFINFYAAAVNNREEGYGIERRNFAVSSVFSSSSIHCSMLQQRRRLWYRGKEFLCQ